MTNLTSCPILDHLRVCQYVVLPCYDHFILWYGHGSWAKIKMLVCKKNCSLIRVNPPPLPLHQIVLCTLLREQEKVNVLEINKRTVLQTGGHQDAMMMRTMIVVTLDQLSVGVDFWCHPSNSHPFRRCPSGRDDKGGGGQKKWKNWHYRSVLFSLWGNWIGR